MNIELLRSLFVPTHFTQIILIKWYNSRIVVQFKNKCPLCRSVIKDTDLEKIGIDNEGRLFYAIRRKDHTLISLITSETFNILNAEDSNILHLAAHNGHIDCLQALIKRGAKGKIIRTDPTAYSNFEEPQRLYRSFN